MLKVPANGAKNRLIQRFRLRKVLRERNRPVTREGFFYKKEAPQGKGSAQKRQSTPRAARGNCIPRLHWLGFPYNLVERGRGSPHFHHRKENSGKEGIASLLKKDFHVSSRKGLASADPKKIYRFPNPVEKGKKGNGRSGR